MDYKHLMVRHNDEYRDRNVRERTINVNRKPPNCPFPFNKTRSGSYFQIPIKKVTDAAEINTLRTTLHQHARLQGIWIKTSIERDFSTDEQNKFVMHVINDGIRKYA